MIALIVDTETTDNDPKTAEVIELAFKPWEVPEDMTVLRFKPSTPIKYGAMATHHIFLQELDGMMPSEMAPTRLPPADFLIGHNVDFDWQCLGEPACRRICTLAMSRDLWPECDPHSLTAMMYWTRGATAETRAMVKGAHSAGDDVLMCESLLRSIMDVAKISDLESLWLYSEEARIPKVMPFGKFRGEPISAVDRGYANWYRRQPDTDPYILQAFKKAGVL